MNIIKILLKTIADLKGSKDLDQATERNEKGTGRLKKEFGGLWRMFRDTSGLKNVISHLKEYGLTATMARGVTKGLSAAWGGLSKLMRGLRNGAIALTAAIAGTVKEFHGWNTASVKAWTMSKLTREEFMAMRKEVLALAPALGVAKSELGEGWYQALSAGVSDNDLVSFLRTAGKVAVADGSTVSTAIDGITTVLNAFKMEGNQAGYIANKMFQTVANGKTTFTELASYISQAAPAAAAFGVSIEEILAAVGTMTKQGIPTSTAMVQIRNAMLTLNKELGDGWSKSLSLQAALEEVAKAGDYSAGALGLAFGRANVSGVLALTGENAKNAANDLAFMKKPVESLEIAFNKVFNETKHWAGLLESFRAVITDIGAAFDKSVRPIVNKIKESLENWRTNTDFFDKLETQLVKAEGMAQDLWFAVSKGGKGGELLGGIGQTLRGVGAAAAQAVISVLLKAAPMIGAAIGAAAKGAIFGDEYEKTDADQARKNLYRQDQAKVDELGGRKAWNKAGKPTSDPLRWDFMPYDFMMTGDDKKRYQAERQRISMQRYQKQGASVSAQYMDMFGNADIAGGTQRISDVAQTGAGLRGQSGDTAQAANSNLQQAAAAGAEATALTAENTSLMKSVWENMRAEQLKQNQTLKDMAERGKQIGG